MTSYTAKYHPSLYKALSKVRSCRAGKVSEFGENFKATIILNTEEIVAAGKISGKVVIETKSYLAHKGVLIQFEGLCMLKYTTKSEGVTTLHQARDCIISKPKQEIKDTLLKMFEIRDNGCPESPIRLIIIPEESELKFINPGRVVYPFTLEIPTDLQPLPAPFKHSFNRLQYRVVVYMKSVNNIFVEVAEHNMRFGGYHNLEANPAALKSISVEQSYTKYMLSRTKLVQVVLSVECAGFLPREIIPFMLYVDNPKCIPMQMSVHLVKGVKIDASGKQGSAKRKVDIVASQERKEEWPDCETTWVEELWLGKSLEPTFTGHSMYHVTYWLHFKVKLQNYGTIKGEAPVYIGTTRTPVDKVVVMPAENTLEHPSSSEGIRRRSWDSSTFSIGSVTTLRSLPPAYSQLSSRHPSMETLPPGYDEVASLEQIEDLSLHEFNTDPNSDDDGDVDTPVARGNNDD